MEKISGSCHNFRPVMTGFAVVCTLAAIILSGCASTQQSIDAAAGKFRPQELEARQAMLAGRHALADILYAAASDQIDPIDGTYVDGHFYLDRARMAGNRAFMALLDGNVEKAQDHFKSSERYLNSGVAAHMVILKDREDTQQGAATLLGLGVVVGAAVIGAGAAADAQTYGQADAIEDVTLQFMEFSIEALGFISRAITEIHEIDVHEDAQDVDPDAWRAAAISDHPIARAVVRVFSRSVEGTSSCTGFFIQPRLVATSAHCLNESDPGRVWVEVHDPRQKKHFLLGEPVRRLVPEGVFWPSTYDPDIVCHPDDVALIVVGEDTPSEYWLTIDTQPVTIQQTAAVVGYSGDLDKGFFQRIDYGCKIEGNDSYLPGLVGHSCATYGGNSGGPVMSVDYSRATNPFRVAGIVSCGNTYTSGIRTIEVANGAANMRALAKVYRSVLAQQPNLGDPRLFE